MSTPQTENTSKQSVSSSESFRGDDPTLIYKNIRFTVKTHYNPPYLWIEEFMSRKRDYRIIKQIDISRELPTKLRQLASIIEEELNRQKVP